jgi:hypothetical protein
MPTPAPFPAPAPEIKIPLPTKLKNIDPDPDCCDVILAELRKIQKRITDASFKTLFPVCEFNQFSRRWEFDFIEQDIDYSPLLAPQIELMLSLFQPLLATECDQRKDGDLDPLVLLSGKSDRHNMVFYVPLPKEIVSVYLVITGQIPSSMSLYKTDSTGEVQGKFGNIGISVQTTSGWAHTGDPGWCWTRKTYYPIPEPLPSLPTAIRISLQPELSFILFDSGERR